jgi:transcriptional regulator
VFSLKERDDREQKVEQSLDQLRVALIEFALFDAIDKMLDLGRISGGDVIVVFHRWRSRRSYARQKRTPRPERKYFLFSRGLTVGARLVSAMTYSFPVEVRQSVNYTLPCRMSRGHMKQTQTDLLQGTLDLLVLKTLQSGPTHGWDIAQRIQQVSQDVLRVGQGSLYPALHRLEAQGWIASEWGASENNRKAKYYKLTAAGRKQLAAETETWRLFTGAVELILKTP